MPVLLSRCNPDSIPVPWPRARPHREFNGNGAPACRKRCKFGDKHRPGGGPGSAAASATTRRQRYNWRSHTTAEHLISDLRSTNPPAADLLTLAIAGDTLALERLLVPYQSRLLARLRRRTPAGLARVLAPEDLLQDSFCDIVRKIVDFKPSGPHAFERWLVTIADNRLIDAIRSWSAAKRGGGWTQATADPHQSHAVSLYELLRVDSHTPSRSAAAHEMHAAIAAAVERLRPEYREAVRLRFLENLEIQEVARRLDRSSWSVHKLCARGLQELERILAADWRSSAR